MSTQNINDEAVKKFKRDVVGACPSLVTLKEQRIVRDIPDEIFEQVLREVFGGDTQLARNVMYDRYDLIDYATAHNEVDNISTLGPASDTVADVIERGAPTLLISDVDNDGSLSQALAMELKRITEHPIDVQPRDYDPGNHGFSIAQINNWLAKDGIPSDSEFLILVSDLGTNQRDTQDEFCAKFPNAHLIVMDHHKPDVEMVMASRQGNTHWVSPFAKGSMRLALRGNGGVSGGYLTYAVFKRAMDTLRDRGVLNIPQSEYENRVSPMREMGAAANLLDFVRCDIRLKPLREAEVKKALDVSKATQKGRSVGKWIDDKHESALTGLTDIIGVHGVQDLLQIRSEMLKQNHLARALLDVVPEVMNLDPEAKKIDINEAVAKTLRAMPVEASKDKNYVEQIRPYLFNFSYENQFDEKTKKDWVGLADNVFRQIGMLEKKIEEKLREYQLVSEISNDFASIVQASSKEVSRAFTTRQIDRAFHSMSKPVRMTIARLTPGEAVLSYRSSLPMNEIVAGVEPMLSGMTFKLRGHSGTGSLTVGLPKGVEPRDALTLLVNNIADEAKRLKDVQGLPKAIEVKPIHLDLVSEMMMKMRVHLEEAAAPALVMRISENMTFEDNYTLEKKSVAKLVDSQEWETTTEPLTFDRRNSLLIPNQALKAIANDNYEGGLGIKLMSNGNYLAGEFFTGEQLRQANIPALTIPLQREQQAMKAEYKKRFKEKELPLVDVPRAAAKAALKFTSDGEAVFHNTEAILNNLLSVVGADSYVVLDVEADGGANAPCFNVGLTIYTRDPNSGIRMSESEFMARSESDPESIRHFRRDGDDFIINEELKVQLASLVMNQDGSQPLRITIKSQIMTNMDQDFIDEVGMSGKEAEEKLVAILKACGKYIIQAHNLPYDNNIARVNYPLVYELMSNAIHLDTAPLAKDHQIAYMNMQVNTIGGAEFYNASHDGYNLSTLFATQESFRYPSVKGKHVLEVNGDSIQILDIKTRLTTSIDIDREELAASLLPNLEPLKMPKYGIQKLMHTATIHDMIRNQPLNIPVKEAFDDFGLGAKLPPELWDMIQENYAYDMTLEQNVAKMSVIPEIAAFTEQSFTMSPSDAAPELIKARSVGAGDSLDKVPGRMSAAAKAEALAAIQSSFSGKDLLAANVLSFLNRNNDNAERFSIAWVYELVLDYHETTRKDPPKSFFAGVSEMTGVSAEMVEKVYSDMYVYKAARGIKSSKFHETHNNCGLEGDTFQEVNVFLHKLADKLRNPYLEAVGKKYGLNPLSPIVNEMHRQAAESTMRQTVRVVVGDLMGEDVVNDYSARQLDNFDAEEGVSLATLRDGVAAMKCSIGRGQSKSKTKVAIELPNLSTEAYRSMPTEERRELEEQMNLALSTLILSNSKSKMPSEFGKGILDELLTSKPLIDNMKYLQEYFGQMNPNGREKALKAFLSTCMDQMVNQPPVGGLSIPVNKDIPPEQLEVAARAIAEGEEKLREQLNFTPLFSVNDEAFISGLENARVEYLAFKKIREDGPSLLQEKAAVEAQLNQAKESIAAAKKASKSAKLTYGGPKSYAEMPELEGYQLGGKTISTDVNKMFSMKLSAMVGGDGELSANAKRQVTSELKSRGNVLQDHIDAAPDLANNIFTTKDDPMGFLMHSPLIDQLIFSVKDKPELALAPEQKEEQQQEFNLSEGLRRR